MQVNCLAGDVAVDPSGSSAICQVNTRIAIQGLVSRGTSTDTCFLSTHHPKTHANGDCLLYDFLADISEWLLITGLVVIIDM